MDHLGEWIGAILDAIMLLLVCVGKKMGRCIEMWSPYLLLLSSGRNQVALKCMLLVGKWQSTLKHWTALLAA